MRTTMKLLLTVVLMAAACLCASAQTIYRPTTWSDYSYPAEYPTAAYDGNLTTAAQYYVTTDDPLSGYTVWSGWTNPTGSRTHVTLQVLSQVSIFNATGYVQCALEYSLDGWKTQTVIYRDLHGQQRAKQWDYVTLPVSQNLSNVQVRATAAAEGESQFNSLQQYIYEIEIVVN
jgi:hypothetical protein